MTCIIDYSAGNISSVANALRFLGEKCYITSNSDEIKGADRVILPGVGSFGDAIDNIKKNKLHNIIYDIADSTIPFLGICLGLQLLFEESDESPGVPGLGIFKGKIKSFRNSPIGDLKVPHVGWNSLVDCKQDSIIGSALKQPNTNPFVYFVHSFYLDCPDADIVSAQTEYGIKFHSAIQKDNIMACQFHPEKSGDTGLKILSEFLKLN